MRFNSRIPLEFGINMRKGCSLYVNKTTLSEQCSMIKAKTFSMLAGVEYSSLDSNMRYVATFGNSAPGTPGDWVGLINKFNKTNRSNDATENQGS